MLVSVAKSHFLLNLSQHCHKSVFLTSESGLFTAFLQKSYQVFFLYKLLFALFCLVLSLFISILLPDKVLLSWPIFLILRHPPPRRWLGCCTQAQKLAVFLPGAKCPGRRHHRVLQCDACYIH